MPDLALDTIDVPFVGGMDTKTDQRQVPLGKLLLLQNMVQYGLKKIVRRPGYSVLGTGIEGGGSLASSQALFARGNELLQVDASQALYAYDKSRANWVSKGTLPSVTATVQSLCSTQYNVRSVDCAKSGNGLICSVFELFDQNATSNQQKGIAYSVYDPNTGQALVSPTVFTSPAGGSQATLPRVVCLGTNFVLFWVETDFSTVAAIYATTLSSTAPLTALPAKTQITSGTTTSALTLAGAQMQYDAKTNLANTAAYLVFTSRSNTATAFRVLSATPTTVSNTKTSALAAGTNYISYALVPDSNGNIVVAGVIAAEMDYAVYNTDFTSTVVAALAADTGQDHLACVTGVATAAGIVSFFYSGDTGADVRRQYIRGFVTSSNYGATTPNKLIGSVSVGGQAFAITLPGGTVAAYCPAWFSTLGVNGVDTQATVYAVNTSGQLVAAALNNQAGCFASTSAPNAVSGSPSGGYLIGSTIVVALQAVMSQARSQRVIGSQVAGQVGSALLYQFSPATVTLNFGDPSAWYMSVQQADTTLVSGSMPYMYDGVNVVEHGFLQYPWDVTGVPGTGGSLTPSSTYLYFVTYEWIDAQGRVHRSAPGAMVGSGALGANSSKVTLTIPTLRATSKTGVLITVWRTTANGSVYFQVNNINGIGTLYNDKTVDTVTWPDTLGDNAITNNPQLYTTGGVQANSPANPVGAMALHRNRVLAIDTTNPTQWWYSQTVQVGLPVQFTPFNIGVVDPQGGPLTAIGSLDDKAIFFKANKIFYVQGQGPDSTGGNNDFTDALPIPGDIGCPFPQSVVAIPDKGLIFQSQKGFFLLDRGLGLSYIGADVEAYTSWSAGTARPFFHATSAVAVPNTTQIRFTGSFANSNGFALVYDWLDGQWSIFTSPLVTNAKAACVWSPSGGGTGSISLYMVLADSGVVMQEDQSLTADNGTFFPIAWTTPWIHLGKLQGYQRLYEMLLLGKYTPDSQSSQQTTVTIDYGYDESNANGDQQVISTWGGSNSSPSFPVQIRIKPKHPRRQSIRLKFTETWSGGTFLGSADEFSALSLLVGISDRPYKVPASNTFG